MYGKFLEKFESIFSDVDNFTPENMESLVDESLKMFKDLQEKLESGDPKVQEKALETTIELKRRLEDQAKSIYETTKMNEKQLDEFMKNPQNFDKKEWASLEKAQEDLKDYQKELRKTGKHEGEHKHKKAKRSKKKGWIAS